MRNIPNLKAEQYRIRTGCLATSVADGNNGAFLIRTGAVTLRVIASDGDNWDHVSVSLSQRCPTWDEMCAVKDLFFRDDETVVQFHPKKSAYINNHKYCLHLWRRQGVEVELPPGRLVGPNIGDEAAQRLSSRR